MLGPANTPAGRPTPAELNERIGASRRSVRGCKVKPKARSKFRLFFFSLQTTCRNLLPAPNLQDIICDSCTNPIHSDEAWLAASCATFFLERIAF